MAIIIYQETAVSALCRRIELGLYYRKHDLHAWTAPEFGQENDNYSSKRSLEIDARKLAKC